jgi:hypothetical protein
MTIRNEPSAISNGRENWASGYDGRNGICSEFLSGVSCLESGVPLVFVMTFFSRNKLNAESSLALKMEIGDDRKKQQQTR